MKAEIIENESVSIATPKGQEIWKAEARKALAEACLLKVVDNESYLAAGEVRDRLGARAKALFALLNPGCQDADRLHSKLVQDRDGCVKPFEEGARTVKQAMIAYDDEQKRIRRLEQARFELEAKKKAEQEALELAETLAAAGAHEAAEQILDEPIQATPVILPRATPKIENFSVRSQWSADVVDLKLLVESIVAGRTPIQAIEPNMIFLNQQARALKSALNFPGVKVSERRI